MLEPAQGQATLPVIQPVSEAKPVSSHEENNDGEGEEKE